MGFLFKISLLFILLTFSVPAQISGPQEISEDAFLAPIKFVFIKVLNWDETSAVILVSAPFLKGCQSIKDVRSEQQGTHFFYLVYAQNEKHCDTNSFLVPEMFQDILEIPNHHNEVYTTTVNGIRSNTLDLGFSITLYPYPFKVEINMINDFTLEVILHGIFSCIGGREFDHTIIRKESNTFYIDTYIKNTPTDGCLAAEQPFKSKTLLDMKGLPPGTYFIDAGGPRKEFYWNEPSYPLD